MAPLQFDLRLGQTGGQFSRSRLAFVLVLRFELGDHGRIGQGGDVAQDAALGDIAQQAAHDFRAARFRQLRRKENIVGPRNGADLLGDVLPQLFFERVARLARIPLA